jgi:hypothetical protein
LEGWAPLAPEVPEALASGRLKPEHHQVLTCLIGRHDYRTGVVEGSLHELMEGCGWVGTSGGSRQTFTRYLDALGDDGWIVLERPPAGSPRGWVVHLTDRSIVPLRGRLRNRRLAGRPGSDLDRSGADLDRSTCPTSLEAPTVNPLVERDSDGPRPVHDGFSPRSSSRGKGSGLVLGERQLLDELMSTFNAELFDGSDPEKIAAACSSCGGIAGSAYLERGGRVVCANCVIAGAA